MYSQTACMTCCGLAVSIVFVRQLHIRGAGGVAPRDTRQDDRRAGEPDTPCTVLCCAWIDAAVWLELPLLPFAVCCPPTRHCGVGDPALSSEVSGDMPMPRATGPKMMHSDRMTTIALPSSGLRGRLKRTVRAV